MIQGILLAAGSGTRFGGQKLLAPLADGVPVAVAAARNLLGALPHSLAVVRPDTPQLAEHLRAEGMEIVEYRGEREGMGFSLACGVAATDEADGWAIALADMPFVRPTIIRELVSLVEGGAALAAPQYRERRGHPVVFGPRFREPLQALGGDAGARDIVKAHDRQLRRLPVADTSILRDIDFPGDLVGG
jgi:molybdenum cofactor cytidylyltransferase